MPKKGQKIFNKVEKELLKQQAWQLKAQFYGYRRIAEKLGVSVGEAFNLIKEVLQESVKKRNFDTVEWRMLQLENAAEMTDLLSEHVMVNVAHRRKGSKVKPKPLFKPNLEVTKQILEWKKFEADIAGTKYSEVGLNMNMEELSNRLREGMGLMNASAGA